LRRKAEIYNRARATQLVDTGCNKQNLKIKLKLLHEKVAISNWPAQDNLAAC
jgi:hypothetical protein